ncbi:hypothetical protein ACHAPT_008141 [Fusarium lateritium]
MGRPRVRQPRHEVNSTASMPTDLINMSTFDQPMSDIFGDFTAQLPPFNMDFGPGRNSSPGHDFFQSRSIHQDNAPASPPQDHQSPCFLHHGPEKCKQKSPDRDTTPSLSTKKCSCVELVNQHFSSVEDSLETFQVLKVLQQSIQSAKSILECNTCFGSWDTNPGTSRNVYLLGSLMSSISSSYGDFFLHQQRLAAESATTGKPIKVLLGQPPDETATVELALDGQSYGDFIRASLRQELGRLLKLSDAFAERQTRLHNQGHEGCEQGKDCTNREFVPDEKHPAEVCPRDVDITEVFSCFRTVDQVRAVMMETQKIISA